MELSVVIPTRNQARLLEACLKSLAAQTIGHDAFEIIVVDDGSTDRTPEVIARAVAGPTNIKPLRFPSNRGRSAARNAGITSASAPIIVFIDSDVVVGTDFLQWHLLTHRRHGPGIVSRGPVALVHDLAAVSNGRAPGGASSPAYMDTANASAEKAALVEAGLFDEKFPGYGWEDFELGLRLKHVGVRRVYCPKAIAYHVQPPADLTDLETLLQKETDRARSALYFLNKHPTLETHLLTQATPLHRALYWLLSGGGSLSPEVALNMARRAQDRGWNQVSHLILRMALNWQYAEYLRTEQQHSRAA